MKRYSIAVVGCTGLVGGKILEVLQERSFPVSKCVLYSSIKSAGTVLTFLGRKHTVLELNEENINKNKTDIVIMSAGSDVSKRFAPLFAKRGSVVVDNSSFWRMDKNVPLVVPEVNPEDVLKHKNIIANPNCSTIQAVVALKPLHDRFGIKRIVYSTYQAVSGAGMEGLNDLENGEKGTPPTKFPHEIHRNLIPHIDSFLDSGYTKEEEKMIQETRKILHNPTLKVTATTVRVPVANCHSESINVELSRPATVSSVKAVLKSAPGVVLCDDVDNNIYPMPINCNNSDSVFVGRIRQDFSVESGLNLWVVADNLRKGAATNAVQIAEILVKEWDQMPHEDNEDLQNLI